MTQYNTLNIKLSNSQLNKLKSGIKNNTKVTLRFSSNVVEDSNDENNFPHKLLLTNTQVSKLRKTFANNLSVNIKLSKTQFHKIRQSGGFLGRSLGPLLKTGLLLIRNALKPLAKSVLIPLGLTAAALATDAAIHKKMFGSGTTILLISDVEMNDIMKIIKLPEESGLLINGFSKTIKSKAKEEKEWFFSMLFGTLGAGLLGHLLACRGTIRESPSAI